VGKDEANQALSLERAQAVKARLVKTGVEPGRITTVGYGEKFPVESNKTPAGRTQNRRVEILVLNEGVAADTQIRK
jgi:outer membrane protein OmpA-like peptidoglycan-associated protein